MTRSSSLHICVCDSFDPEIHLPRHSVFDSQQRSTAHSIYKIVNSIPSRILYIYSRISRQVWTEWFPWQSTSLHVLILDDLL